MEDSRVLGMVMQWLGDEGYDEARDSLAKQSGVDVDGCTPELAHELVTILNDFALREVEDPETTPSGHVFDDAPEPPVTKEAWRASAADDGGPHASNILCVRFRRGGDGKGAAVLATGGADGRVCRIEVTRGADGSVTGRVAARVDLGRGAVLTVDWAPPVAGDDRAIVVCGCLDGSVHIVDLGGAGGSGGGGGGGTLVSAEGADAHDTYCVCARFVQVPDGGALALATCSYDHTVRVYRVEGLGRGGCDGDDGGGPVTLEGVDTFRFASVIETLAVAPHAPEVVFAVRGETEMCYLDVARALEAAAARSGGAPAADGAEARPGLRRVPLSAAGERCGSSVTSLHNAVSPGGGYVLSTTDDARLIVFPYGSPAHARTMFGATTSMLSNPSAAWDSSGAYVYATSEGGGDEIVVFDVKSQSIAARLKGHAGRVRDLDFAHPGSGIGRVLASVSFDKSLRLWVMDEDKDE